MALIIVGHSLHVSQTHRKHRLGPIQGLKGKGFAVVASEVKDLAKATGKATEEISGKISAIQKDTQSAVDAIGEIEKLITQTNEISVSIAGAIEEQAVTTNEITRHAAEAAREAEIVVNNISGMKSVTEETADEMTTVFNASQRLAKMGEELTQLVDKFHVD